MIKALLLFSGGLDSLLSALLLREQGIYVKALHFYTGFCTTEFKRRIGIPKENPALKSAASVELPIEIVDISQEYFNIVLNPKFGYGKNVNPCIDCRIYMLKKAKEIMESEGYHFIATGEVVGQRPMSQTLPRLKLIEKEAQLEGLIVRPLSAKLLPPTIPEKMGWVDREKLLDISGRSRKKQIQLAQKYGIDYQQPAGGCCYLTDENYAFRFKEAYQVDGFITREDLVLFSVGRHFRLPSKTKVIVARNEGEYKFLYNIREKYGYAKRVDGKGTFAIIKGDPTEEEIKDIAGIINYYSKKEPGEVYIKLKDRDMVIHSQPLSKEAIESFMLSLVGVK